MELITAIIQPFMLDRLTRTLRMQEITGYTVTELKGSVLNLNDSADYLQPRVKVEIAVNNEESSNIIQLISKTVRTHQEGDGIIYSVSLNSFSNIQTGLTGPEALAKQQKKD
ncbi:MAG: P-II family nitrogen regulator [Candidatus Obscuribacterales bacterium]|nr:P-II family nitrogen regulator [Candidatus Obscuribacterales bacterium]